MPRILAGHGAFDRFNKKHMAEVVTIKRNFLDSRLSFPTLYITIK